MATAIYIVKRKLKGQRKNGQPHYRYALRWRDPVTREQKGEATGTADMTQARELQKLKWAEVNGVIEPREESLDTRGSQINPFDTFGGGRYILGTASADFPRTGRCSDGKPQVCFSKKRAATASILLPSGGA